TNYSMIYRTNQLTGEPLTEANLADISTIISVDGVPVGEPPNQGFGHTNWDGLKNDRPSHEYAYTIVDLEGTYHYDYAYIWYAQPSNTLWGFRIWTSEDGYV